MELRRLRRAASSDATFSVAASPLSSHEPVPSSGSVPSTVPTPLLLEASPEREDWQPETPPPPVSIEREKLVSVGLASRLESLQAEIKGLRRDNVSLRKQLRSPAPMKQPLHAAVAYAISSTLGVPNVRPKPRASAAAAADETAALWAAEEWVRSLGIEALIAKELDRRATRR